MGIIRRTTSDGNKYPERVVDIKKYPHRVLVKNAIIVISTYTGIERPVMLRQSIEFIRKICTGNVSNRSIYKFYVISYFIFLIKQVLFVYISNKVFIFVISLHSFQIF